MKKVKAKEFDTVETFRKIKEDISKEIQDMSFEQLKVWLDKNQQLLISNGANTYTPA